MNFEKSIIKKFLCKMTDLIFPRRCTICDTVISDNSGICMKCRKKVTLLSGETCMICGKKLKNEQAGVNCYDCSRRKHEFIRNFAVFEYPDLRKSLYRFKYQGRAEYAGYYAKQAYELHGQRIELLGADALIPVPLHSSRYRKRGYNQAEEFAGSFSALSQIPVKTDFIRRVKSTKPLKTLDVSGRQNNLKKAFLIMQNDVKLKTIILVDDIYTTGATLDEIAGLCKEAGVEKVYSLTVAIGSGL